MMAKKQETIKIDVPSQCLEGWLRKLAKIEKKLRRATSSS